ncbi:MAG: 1-acyl-sn-glycerol-3-phosphate acyltransferase, partial [Deltaproteobacteria bacterium]|nr:1-acyl-sn-glycerol-3-phosphate acyltransferase [Deltaproteobacteria bacterium]
MDSRRTPGKFRRWVNRYLKGRHDYFSSSLPKDWGYSSFLAPILRSLFANVSLTSTQTAILKTLPENAIIVYVSKYKSSFEYLFYHIRYKAEGLPFPQLGFDYTVIVWQKLSRLTRIVVAHLDHFFKHRTMPDPFQSGFYARQLRAGRIGFLSLVDRKGFYDRFVKARHDPLALLIDLQRQTTRPVILVPQWLLFSKKPLGNPLGLADIFFANAENPGPLRRWLTILRTPQKACVEISEPLSLHDFLGEPGHGERPAEQLSFALRRRLLDAMNRHRQSITGPILKTREELKELVLRNDRFQAFLNSHAKNGKNTLAQLHKKADAALDEIAADYSPRFIRVLCIIFGWIWKTMFDGVVLDMDGLGRVKRAATKGPIVFVPCHRSHFDYLILPYLLISNNMPCPHVAAGRNLAFWPMGPLIRRSGAFFIRRSFHGARLYAKVFSEYVRVLVQQGFNIEFFIEGGRSRTGKMVLPKTGLLTILM